RRSGWRRGVTWGFWRGARRLGLPGLSWRSGWRPGLIETSGFSGFRVCRQGVGLAFQKTLLRSLHGALGLRHPWLRTFLESLPQPLPSLTSFEPSRSLYYLHFCSYNDDLEAFLP